MNDARKKIERAIHELEKHKRDIAVPELHYNDLIAIRQAFAAAEECGMAKAALDLANATVQQLTIKAGGDRR